MDIPIEKLENVPSIIEGGLHVDTNGSVRFVNAFDFCGVDRFYTIQTHRANEPRGWRGHRIEDKWFTVVSGTVLVAVVQPDDWTFPSSHLPVQRFVLSAVKPQLLHVPPGYATGNLHLTQGAVLLVFSSGKIEDAVKDNYRFPAETWPIAAHFSYALNTIPKTSAAAPAPGTGGYPDCVATSAAQI